MAPVAPITLRCPRRAAPPATFPDANEWIATPAHALVQWNAAPDPLAATHGASTFRLLWDEASIHLRADVTFARLHLDSAALDRARKRHGLWEFDVVELFLSRGAAPTPYGEVEGSALGQCLDYFVESPRRIVDREWRSGAQVRGAIADRRFTVEIALPWVGLGAVPRPGAPLRFNVYAAQGVPGERRFLAFAPTATAEPDFHVPERFAHLVLE